MPVERLAPRFRHQRRRRSSGSDRPRNLYRADALSAGILRPLVVLGGAPIVLDVWADSRAAEEAEGAVPDEDKKRAAHRDLVDRILHGEGRASAQQRARAFSNEGLSSPMDALIGKVVTRPAQVSEADFAVAKASGFSEDQLFELVICAAVGQSARLYEAGLAALAEATVNREAG
jgi:hypothetical protein